MNLTFILPLFLSSLALAATTGSHEAAAKRTPWSGYWWSMAKGELVLGWKDGQGRNQWSEKDAIQFDGCISSYTAACEKLLTKMAGPDGASLSPLMKFDYAMRKYNDRIFGKGGAPSSAFTHASKWEIDQHYIGTNSSHRYWNARGFSGKCIGWALSTIDFDEPTQEVMIEGIVFKPADIKGLLASIYNGAQFFVPDALAVGNAYYENSGTPADAEDVLPHELFKALAQTIDKGQILEADLDPGAGVWNYPVHRYQMKWQQAKPGTVTGEITLSFANDEVEIDEVFSTRSSRPDLKTRRLTFELSVPAAWKGDMSQIKSSRWTGKSLEEHPDALILGLEKNWRNTIYQYKNTRMNEEVNFQLIKRIQVNRKWVPFVDILLRQYYAQ